MNIIADIKTYFKKQNIIWDGMIFDKKEKTYRKAESEDFLNSQTQHLSLIKNDNELNVTVLIDQMYFMVDEIENEEFELFQNYDQSQNWVHFQLKQNGFVSALAIKKRCEEEKEKITQEHEMHKKRMQRKIEFLEKKIEDESFAEKEEIEKVSIIEGIVEKSTEKETVL